MRTTALNKIITTLSNIHLKCVFNPYADYCSLHDQENAAAIRGKNLSCYLDYQFQHKPKQLWLAEAGSYNGLRRTGIPLVPETVLETEGQYYDWIQSCHKATTSRAKAGYTNKIIWQEAIKQEKLPFLWNAIMAQPYLATDPSKNRTPTITELKNYVPIIMQLQEIFQFETIICIGRRAGRILQIVELPHTYVRHPAQGGAKEFKTSIAFVNS